MKFVEVKGSDSCMKSRCLYSLIAKCAIPDNSVFSVRSLFINFSITFAFHLLTLCIKSPRFPYKKSFRPLLCPHTTMAQDTKRSILRHFGYRLAVIGYRPTSMSRDSPLWHRAKRHVTVLRFGPPRTIAVCSDAGRGYALESEDSAN